MHYVYYATNQWLHIVLCPKTCNHIKKKMYAYVYKIYKKILLL